MSDYDYFSTTEISARLDLVRHLIENSELVPLVRGPSGVGKTVLASRIQQLAPENWSVCHFEADPTMQPERLLATIARCCGLPDIAGELLQRLVDRFEVLRKRGRIPVLLVDDAQMLPPTSLITLLRLFERQLDGVRLVSIVLFADEQIDLLLSTPQLQIMSPQAIQVIDMPLLTRQETTAYMLFLIKNEGLSDQLALDEIKLNRIHRETKGNPGPMTTAILNALGEEGDDKRAGFNLSGYRKQLLFGGVPLLLLLFVLLFLGPIRSLFEPEPAPVSESRAEKGIEPLPAPASISQREAPPAKMTRTEATTPAILDTSEEEHAEVGALIVEEPATIIEISSPPKTLQEMADTLVVDETAPAIEETREQEHTVEDNSLEQVSVEESVEEAVEREADTVTAVVEEGSVAVDNEETGATDVSQEPAAVVKEELPPASDTGPDEVALQSASAGDEKEPVTVSVEPAEDASLGWVMSRSPNSYTLQLIAVENLESLKRYIAKNRLGSDTHTFKMNRNGRPLYALLWGDFPDRNRAQKAVSSLPPAIQKEGVWARTFASLQRSQAQ
ncbi:MAG: AAA family ATPase [Candidatus Thiodiazotropha sp.]